MVQMRLPSLEARRQVEAKNRWPPQGNPIETRRPLETFRRKRLKMPPSNGDTTGPHI